MRAVKYGYNREERNLILYSDHARADYPDLFEYVQKNEKAIPGRVDTSTENGQALEYLLTRQNQRLSDIIYELQLEWILDKSAPTGDSEKTLVCELCGQTGLLENWLLINRSNNRSMKIGRECIKKYSLGKYGTEGKSHEEFLFESRLRQRMSKRELEADTKSNGAFFRFTKAQSKWKSIPFLPSAKTTHEIINLMQIEISVSLQIIRDPSQCLNTDILNLCDDQVTRLENLLDVAYEEVEKPSAEWRVSNAVYRWAKEKDKKKKKDEVAIVTLLEQSCNINSDNVALIMEEGHKIECMNRLGGELPNNYRIKTVSGQSDLIKIYIAINDSEYPFWVRYDPLIKQVAKHGFPEHGSLLSFSQKDLAACVPAIDLHDGNTGYSFLQNAIRENGASVRDEDSSGHHYLLSRNTMGSTLEINGIIPCLSNAIITGENDTFMRKLGSKIDGADWKKYDVAQSDWNEIFG